MNRTESLLRTAELSVERFDHPPGDVHHDPDHEIGETFSLAFVTHGHFAVHVVTPGRRASTPLGAGGILLLHPGLRFRCQHAEQCPNDICVSVRFTDAAVAGVEDAWTATPWSARTEATPRLAFVQRQLARAIDRRDALAVEQWALAGIDALERDTHGPRGAYVAPRAELEAVLAACDAIDADPTRPLSVAERAHAVSLTALRLTRAFRRHVGLAPHQYVVRQRLRRAADLLAAGVSVTDACYASGFESLSHFVRSFHRTVGVRPSAWRSLPLSAQRAQIVRIGQAPVPST